MAALREGLGGIQVDQSNINNLKDIMMTYNKITEICFNRCVSSLNSKSLSDAEEQCVSRCSGKFVTGNQRIMTTFMGVQTKRQEGMAEEQKRKEIDQQKQAEIGVPSPITSDGSEALTTSVSPSQPEVLQRINVINSMNKQQQQEAASEIGLGFTQPTSQELPKSQTTPTS